MKVRMDRASKSTGKSIDANGSGKQGRTSSTAGGGHGSVISCNDYGSVNVPQTKKMG